MLRTHCIQSASFAFRCYIISGTVTSCMMSWHHVCMSHMTFGYKSSHRALFEALLLWYLLLFIWFSVCPSGSPLAPAYSWCPMRVGHNVSSVSLGWSLLPSSVLIVLALVNSDIPYRGTWVSQRDPGVLPHSLTVPIPQDCCAFWLVPMSIMVEATLKWTAWLPLRVFCIRCVTILGIPGYIGIMISS